MTNQKTPEQGGATEEQIEAAALALFTLDNGQDDAFSRGVWKNASDDAPVKRRYRELAVAAFDAALSASASAHPAAAATEEQIESAWLRHAARTGVSAEFAKVPNGSSRAAFFAGARAALAAPVEVDEARLAQLIQNAEDGDLCANGWSRKPGPGQRQAAHAVAEWLRGKGR